MPTVTTLLPSALYTAGVRTFGPVVVPVGITGFRAAIDRTSLLSPTLHVSWSLELSLDAGASWLPWGGAGTIGGVVTNPATGLPYTESAFSVGLVRVYEFGGTALWGSDGAPLPADASIVPGWEPDNPDRRLRGSVTLTEDATTAVTLTTYP